DWVKASRTRVVSLVTRERIVPVGVRWKKDNDSDCKWALNAFRKSSTIRCPTYSIRYALPKLTTPRKTKVPTMTHGKNLSASIFFFAKMSSKIRSTRNGKTPLVALKSNMQIRAVTNSGTK